MGWVRSQFDTRTIVLIPIAIAINIVLGQTVAAALKVPIYLDSIGTILVGAIAGPIPGLVTGALANLIWQFVLPAPFHSDFAGPYFIVAAEIGFLAGIFGARGFFRSRPNSSTSQLALGGIVAAVIILLIVVYGVLPFYKVNPLLFFGDTSGLSPVFVAVGYVIGIGIIAAAIGFFYLLFVKRDLGVAYIVVGGVVCGVISALISAPITAVAFGGVTGSGTDLLVAAFQQAGSDLQTAVLQQGLLSDPVDKTITYFVVFLLLQTLSRRFIARFPQGEKAIGLEGA
jgi:energy-coupling factor transport system substrate-specific component